MEKEIEIECRGRLNNEAYEDLRTKLKKEGVFQESRERILLDYSTFLPDEGIKERSRDIRLRVTNGQPEIITKIGGWGGSEHREEISVLCNQGSFDSLVQTYAVLGYTKAVLAIRFSEVFKYKGFEFALVEVPGHSYYFEIEALVQNESEVDAKKAKIRTLCAQLNLKLFDDEDFYEYIEILNSEANEVFDYSSYTLGYFGKRFNL